jgi:hypothetical protein
MTKIILGGLNVAAKNNPIIFVDHVPAVKN